MVGFNLAPMRVMALLLLALATTLASWDHQATATGSRKLVQSSASPPPPPPSVPYLSFASNATPPSQYGQYTYKGLGNVVAVHLVAIPGGWVFRF